MYNNFLNRLIHSIVLWLGFVVFFSSNVHGTVLAEKSRIIFQGKSVEKSLLLVNKSDYPVMVQSWVDDGDLQSTPDKAISPFVVIPPVFKMQPNEFATLRIIYSGSALPSDKESLYWLNIYEVPPVAANKEDEAAKVTLALRTQIKVLYRPSSIPQRTEKSGQLIQFTREADNLIVKNPTGYYQTVTTLTVCGQMYSQAGMLEPLSSIIIPAPLTKACENNSKIQYTLIDDSGNEESHHQQLSK